MNLELSSLPSWQLECGESFSASRSAVLAVESLAKEDLQLQQISVAQIRTATTDYILAAEGTAPKGFTHGLFLSLQFQYQSNGCLHQRLQHIKTAARDPRTFSATEVGPPPHTSEYLSFTGTWRGCGVVYAWERLQGEKP